jgi:protein SCO1
MVRFAWKAAAVLAALTAAPAPGWAAPPQQSAQAVFSGRFDLVDQDGRAVTEDSYAGHFRVMTFGYTFCPDICPTTLGTIATTLDRLGPAAAQVEAIFVSVDPERDTPAHLKEYVAAFHPRMVGLSGTAAQVAAAARSFKVRYARQPATDGDPDHYTVDHSAGIFILDRNGAFIAKLGYRATPDELTERLRPLLGLK